MWQGGPSAGFGRRARAGDVNNDNATKAVLTPLEP